MLVLVALCLLGCETYVCCLKQKNKQFHFRKTADELKLSLKKQTCYSTYPRIIWSYWNDQNDIAEDVEEMINVTRKSLANFSYVFLTERNLSYFMNISTFPTYFRKLSVRHKCDYLRWCLLEKHGGLYVDASTYITSGSEMEWFFCQAMKSKAEMFGYGGSHVIYTNFVGASLCSEPLVKIKSRLDVILSSEFDFYKYCKKFFCLRRNKKSCSWHVSECINEIVVRFIKRNPSLHKKILANDRRRSHYRLYIECKDNNACVSDRLLIDPKIRSYPFIKVEHHVRLGRKVGFVE